MRTLLILTSLPGATGCLAFDQRAQDHISCNAHQTNCPDAGGYVRHPVNH
jgi:hypothetical protein